MLGVNRKHLVPGALVMANLALLLTTAPAVARDRHDGYGECFQEAGTTRCTCEQYEFNDCDLCAIVPCNDVWPQYCDS